MVIWDTYDNVFNNYWNQLTLKISVSDSEFTLPFVGAYEISVFILFSSYFFCKLNFFFFFNSNYINIENIFFS